MSSSDVKLVAVPVAFVSMIGASPLTVIVSATLAIFSVTGSSTFLPTDTIDVFADDGGEALERRGYLVGTGGQVEKAVFTIGFRGEGLGQVDALDGHRDAGEHAALFVLDGAADAAALKLRERGKRGREQQREHETESFHFDHFLLETYVERLVQEHGMCHAATPFGQSRTWERSVSCGRVVTQGRGGRTRN